MGDPKFGSSVTSTGSHLCHSNRARPLLDALRPSAPSGTAPIVPVWNSVFIWWGEEDVAHAYAILEPQLPGLGSDTKENISDILLDE